MTHQARASPKRLCSSLMEGVSKWSALGEVTAIPAPCSSISSVANGQVQNALQLTIVVV